MPISPLNVALQYLLADLRPGGDGMTDGELLARFVRSRDDDALAALVRRHASMVWGVCRRLLNHHDAEDAFQATFLVLVHKAADVPREAVANWLYGVARQTAVRLRATVAKRGRRETQVVNMLEPTVPEVHDADLQRVVDEELSRLPDHYRGVVILCDLEGVTRKEAARQLGIPEGSVASRLARARAMLAKRLNQRDIVFSGGSVAAVLSAGSASGSAPPVLVASTIKVASLLAAGQAAGGITAKVAALTEGVLKTMFMTKIKNVLAVVVVAALVGGAGLIYTTAAAQDGKKSPTGTPMEPATNKATDKEVVTAWSEKVDDATAWGRPVNGLQAGLRCAKNKQIIQQGQLLDVTVVVRNVSDRDIRFTYIPPTLFGGEAEKSTLTVSAMYFGNGLPNKTNTDTICPGKELLLGRFSIGHIHPKGYPASDKAYTALAPGKYQVGSENVVVPPLPDAEVQWRLPTGYLDIELVEAK